MFVGDGFYLAINNYVYGGFKLGMKNTWAITKMSFSAIGPMMRGAPERWQEAREKFAVVVDEWESKDIYISFTLRTAERCKHGLWCGGQVLHRHPDHPARRLDGRDLLLSVSITA